MTNPSAAPRTLHRRRPAIGLALAAVITAVLATAAGPARALVSGTFFVPSGFERVAWTYPGLDRGRTPQITEIGPWARTDYARFAGPAGQGEVLFKTANYGPYVLHHAPGLSRIARSWNHLRGRIRGWHRAGAVRSYQADTSYRLLTLDNGRSCVVFSGEGEPVTYDSEARPGLVYLGYFCARPDVTLDAGAAQAVIRSLRLTYDRRTPTPDRGPSAKAEAIAKGSVAGRSGNARFPFPLATPYNENDGSREHP
jgi:hypothetical protein